MVARRKQDRSRVSLEQALEAALELFSSQGFGATSMRQIAERSGLSMGNLYHHFANKEAIFKQLLDRYWERLQDPEHPLQQLFARADFPDDLEDMAAAIEQVVRENRPYILLIYVDVVEFRGAHIGSFYEGMAERFREVYGTKLEARKAAGELGEIDPLVGVILAVRWFFYFFTIEQCFGAPMHFGMNPQQATEEFIRLLRYGLLPRGPSGNRPPESS
ncbi:MAG: TetR/AcrR family transcriptional regulator [Acidobacteriota bacterium]|nr:TetR/AcrR family transcriptional regulator [Acidobacteriota bacterium]